MYNYIMYGKICQFQKYANMWSLHGRNIAYLIIFI